MSRQEPQFSTRTSAVPQTASKYSADVVQHLLDRAFYFHLYSSPRAQSSVFRTAIRRADCDIGFQIRERLRRFEVLMDPPSVELGLRASNAIGEVMGTFESRWLFCPDDFQALPYIEPPPTSFDPTRRQRFVMLDGNCVLGNNGDGFYSFGTGTTFPS